MKRQHRSSQPSLPARIIVGVDDAGYSDHAVRRGFDLAARLQAELRLVHAVPAPPEVWPGVDPLRSVALSNEILAAAHKVINGRVRALAASESRGEPAPRRAVARSTATLDAPPGEDPVRLIPGPPAKVLLDEAQRASSDWILLGSHRRRGFLDFGSTLRAVFAKSTVPVWVQSDAPLPIERILAPVDLSEESLHALALACALAATLRARVHALHCFRFGSYAMAGAIDHAAYGAVFPTEDVLRAESATFEQAMEGFDWRGVEHTTEFAEGLPAEAILDRARTSDLVVMGSHGRTGLASVVLGGTTYAVLKHSTKPVLVARHPERRFLLGEPD